MKRNTQKDLAGHFKRSKTIKNKKNNDKHINIIKTNADQKT